MNATDAVLLRCDTLAEMRGVLGMANARPSPGWGQRPVLVSATELGSNFAAVMSALDLALPPDLRGESLGRLINLGAVSVVP